MPTIRRAFNAPIAAHLVLLAIVLLGVLFYVRPLGLYLTDEGLSVFQARQLETTGHWVYPTPDPRIDPTGDATVMVNSDGGAKGRAFYVKHPLYPIVLEQFDRIGGRAGMFLLTLAGLWGTAAITALIAKQLGLNDSGQRWTLWALGVGSPLIMYGYQIVAHTLAAFFAAVFVYAFTRVLKRPTVVSILAMFLSLMIAVLLRSEIVFLGLGAALALFLFRVRSSPVRTVLLCAVPMASSVVGYAIDRLAIHAIVGRPVDTVPIVTGSWLSARWDGFFHTMLLYGSSYTFKSHLVGLAVAAFAIGAIHFRLRHVRAVAIGCWSIGALLLTISAISGYSGLIPSLFAACPIALLGVLLLSRADLKESERAVLVAAAAFSSAGIILTQYAGGGGAEWGARYFNYLWPIWTPVIVVVLQRTLRECNSQMLLAVFVIAMLSVDTIGIRSIPRVHHLSRNRELGVQNAIAQVQNPYVIWTNPFTVQLLWNGVDTQRTLLVNKVTLDELVDRVHAVDRQAPIVIITDQPDSARALKTAGYETSTETLPGAGLVAITGLAVGAQ